MRKQQPLQLFVLAILISFNSAVFAWTGPPVVDPVPGFWYPAWDCPTQCHGNADCDVEGSVKGGYREVSTADLSIFLAVSSSGIYDPAADFNRDGQIDGADETIITTWYDVIGVPTDCPIHIYVPGDYATIQAAVDAAAPGDTIVVAPGTYNENVDVDSKNNITLQGSGSDVTTIDGGANGHVVVFNTASGSLSGFTITNSGSDPLYSAGVFASHSTVDVFDNVITGNHNGVKFSSSADGLIYGNRITNNTDRGITIMTGADAVITNNLIANNSDDGIHCSSTIPYISNNTIFNNDYGIYCAPTSTQTITNNIIMSNRYGIMAVGGSSSPVPLLDISYNDVFWNTNDYWYDWAIACIPEDPECVPAGGSGTFSPSPGTGEIHTDPLFADSAAGDFHLKSQQGRWDTGTSSWVTDTVTSLAIDAGDPDSSLGDEPASTDNVRINIGAYGGTDKASKTPGGWGLLTDANNDWSVDLPDLQILAQQWIVSADYVDYSKLADEWLTDRSTP